MADPTGSGSNGGTTTVVSNPPNPPTTNTVPNTTTNTTTVQYQSATSNTSVDPGTGGEGFGLGTPDGNGGFVNAQGDPVDANGTPIAGVPPTTYSSPVNDALAGLSPTQLQDLGGADPTDPYIRARLGIPQLPGSTLNVTSGFGFGNLTTNFPSIDNALGTIRNLFSGTIGGLFSNTVASTTAATTGSGVAALVAPTGTSTTLTPVDATTTEGFGIQATVDPTTLEGYGVPVSNNTTTLNADQADAYYNGTGTLTADQRLAQDQQIAADAAKLYPGSNNEALRQIDIGAGRIAENEVGIANAEQIVNRNNAELADPNISDARRAELLANNEAQQEYIQVATENIAIQENVIEQNANVYAAGGGNPDSGQGPDQVAALTDPGLDPNFVSDAEQIAARDRIAVNEAQDLTTSEDPFEQSRLDAQEASDAQPPDEFEPQDVSAEQDPFEQRRLELEQEANREQLAMEATDVEPGLFTGQTDEFGGVDEAVAQRQQDVENQNDPGLSAEETDAEFERLRTQDQETNDVDPGPGYVSDSEQIAAQGQAAVNEAQESQFQGSQQASIVAQAKKQATVQARYKQPGNTDWRVRLSLGPGAQYLYNATPAGILAPLAANGGTDGVIFPYTPSVTTAYSANYEQYDLIHSNYRGLFYKNSRVGDIQLRGTFTAQNTTEANYLLATIHFFRSVTKMFYGQDAERGTPPPICLLNGFGGYQFSDHPVVVSSFNYTLPNDVDYIRTTNPNNFGLDLNNRYNPSGASLPAGGALAGVYRLLNAIPGGLNKGALPRVPAPNTVVGSVTNNTPASYVPTKMEIDVTLIPVQSRSQVSQQFSLKGFANGDLLKGGFW